MNMTKDEIVASIEHDIATGTPPVAIIVQAIMDINRIANALEKLASRGNTLFDMQNAAFDAQSQNGG